MKVNELEVDFQQWARYAIVSLFATLPKTCSPWDLAAVTFCAGFLGTNRERMGVGSGAYRRNWRVSSGEGPILALAETPGLDALGL